MSEVSKKTFWPDFRRFFLRGLATLLPTILTIVLLVKCFEFIQDNISVHITEGVIRLVVLTTDDYPGLKSDELTEYITEKKPGIDTATLTEYQREQIREKDRDEIRLWKLRGQWKSGPRTLVGFVLAIILVYIVGRLLASYIGRKLWQLFETGVKRIPGFKQVYPYIKQVTDYLFGENKIEFSRVVAIPYPRNGIWSLGLVTGAGFSYVGQVAKEEFLTVFVPSSPTPITGYVVHVKKGDVVDLPISIEEAMRFVISGGVIVPDHQALPTQRIELSPGPSVSDSK